MTPIMTDFRTRYNQATSCLSDQANPYPCDSSENRRPWTIGLAMPIRAPD